MIIDIRSKEEYIKGHIEKAICIPETELYSNPDSYLDKRKEYQLYCNSGVRSQKLTDYLNLIGYQCVNIKGGYWHYLLSK